MQAAITAAGAAPLIDLQVDFSTTNFSSRTSVLGAAKAFGDLSVAAYYGVGRYIIRPSYPYLASKITIPLFSNSRVSTNNVLAGTSLKRAPAEVAALVNAYLVPGFKLDVSGIR